VKAVTLTTSIPMLNDTLNGEAIAPEGFQYPPGKEGSETLASKVDEYFFDAMAIPLVEGRNFTRQDDEGATRVAIVNQHFAQHYWPNQDPLGKRFRLKSAKDTWVEIVGVAKTSKYIFIAEPPTDFVYLPYRQSPSSSMMLVAQSAGDPGALAAPLRDVVRGMDASMPVFNMRTMERLYHMRAISVFNVLVTTVAAMGLMGLALAIVGLYGLVAYAAARRTREIGIRMAIGATAPTVLRMVLRQGVTLAVTGLVLGLAGSIGAGVLLSAAFPSGNDQRDFLSLALVAPVVLLVTVLATYIPARRASRVNPMEALRYE
jgi:predicted permease